MAETHPPEKCGLNKSADWWSAGQAAGQQIYGAATERARLKAIPPPRRRHPASVIFCQSDPSTGQAHVIDSGTGFHY